MNVRPSVFIRVRLSGNKEWMISCSPGWMSSRGLDCPQLPFPSSFFSFFSFVLSHPFSFLSILPSLHTCRALPTHPPLNPFLHPFLQRRCREQSPLCSGGAPPHPLACWAEPGGFPPRESFRRTRREWLSSGNHRGSSHPFIGSLSRHRPSVASRAVAPPPKRRRIFRSTQSVPSFPFPLPFFSVQPTDDF